ncbi:anti-sigma factor family protein [Croceicoccus naphthovorans]|uniref:Uncharacterized protein n=1 Tax=Croceicoccus naphthovorans TaxID=1348774 RepID=A0A0G3XDW7_9SPHN|nr:hypothetical protein [Croceicoccus naphthovorans]AKM08799.1 hypothetical protein AB433_00380 [Croceicoccus naphthovorans]MBB3991684.1 hypothetical protein [Croceicoccus naphthovorans]
MSVTREELAAFADGELDSVRHAEIERAVEADPALARAVANHRALRTRLSAHYAPILDDPVPERLEAMLQNESIIVDLQSRRKLRTDRLRHIPRWGWITAPALAACLILALLIPRGSAPDGYATQQIASALDDQLVATQPADATVRVLLSFRDSGGLYCRVYASTQQDGIACKDEQGWRLIEQVGRTPAQATDYRQAGNASAELMAKAQELAAGPALDASDEVGAMAENWRTTR